MASWRKMTTSDIHAVIRVAEKIHPDLPESESVFAERLRLFPDGCWVLADDRGEMHGYAISHPIRHQQPPPLDSLLGEIAPDADQYYIHDLAILPTVRNQGHAANGIGKLLEVARTYGTTCLISVYGTAPFWGRFGFVPEPVDGELSEKLRKYGEGATYLVRQNAAQ